MPRQSILPKWMYNKWVYVILVFSIVIFSWSVWKMMNVENQTQMVSDAIIDTSESAEQPIVINVYETRKKGEATNRLNSAVVEVGVLSSYDCGADFLPLAESKLSDTTGTSTFSRDVARLVVDHIVRDEITGVRISKPGYPTLISPWSGIWYITQKGNKQYVSGPKIKPVPTDAIHFSAPSVMLGPDALVRTEEAALSIVRDSPELIDFMKKEKMQLPQLLRACVEGGKEWVVYLPLRPYQMRIDAFSKKVKLLDPRSAL